MKNILIDEDGNLKTTKGHYYIKFNDETVEDALDCYVGSKGHTTVESAIKEADTEKDPVGYVILDHDLKIIYTKEMK